VILGSLHRCREYAAVVRYVGVGRVSTDSQGQNLSREVQFEAIHAYGRAQLWHCVGEFFDTASGAEKGIDERDGLSRAITAIAEKRADYLLMYDVSRIGREAVVIRDLIDRVYAVGGRVGVAVERRLFETALEGRESMFWTGNVSEWEWLQVRKRTQTGKKKALELGSFVWRPVFGYRLEKQGKAKKLVVDGTKSPIVVEVFERLARGEQRSSIARWCQSQGYRWENRRLAKFIERADLYAGGSIELGVTLEGVRHTQVVRYPPLITLELAERVKASRIMRFRGDSKPTPYLGVLVCRCGRGGMAVARAVGRTGRRRVQLACSTKLREKRRRAAGHAPESHCSHSLAETKLTKYVVAYLLRGHEEFRNDIDALALVVQVLERNVAELQAALAKNGAERDRLLNRVLSFERLDNVVEALNARLGTLSDEEKAIRNALARQEDHLRHDSEKLKHMTGQDWRESSARVLLAIEAEEWREVSRLLAGLRVSIIVDFANPSPEETVEIQIGAAPVK